MIEMGNVLMLKSFVAEDFNEGFPVGLTPRLILVVLMLVFVNNSILRLQELSFPLQFPNLKSPFQCCSDHNPSIRTTDICPVPASLLLYVSLPLPSGLLCTGCHFQGTEPQ